MHERSIRIVSLNFSSYVSLITSITSIFIKVEANFLATYSVILIPVGPCSTENSFVKEIYLGRLSVISSSAPPFLGSGLAAAAGFLAGAPPLTGTSGSTGFGSSPSILIRVQSLKNPVS
jgi:hypothetical protein